MIVATFLNVDSWQIIWMTLEFDPRSKTAQDEDSFFVMHPASDVALLCSNSTFNASSVANKVWIVPGNSLTFSMESASLYQANARYS